MHIYNQASIAKFMELIPQIRKSVDDWKIINITSKSGQDNKKQIAENVIPLFEKKESVAFIYNQEFLILSRLGKQADLAELKEQIESALPRHQCHISASSIRPERLKQVELRLELIAKKSVNNNSLLFSERQQRRENIFLLVVNEIQGNSPMSQTLRSHGQVIEIVKGERVTDTYLATLPDVVFLEIDLLTKPALTVLEEILDYDETAHVVMMGAGSTKKNVITAKELGAKNFITQPYNLERLKSLIQACPTISRRGNLN